jgi:hypothetical protein
MWPNKKPVVYENGLTKIQNDFVNALVETRSALEAYKVHHPNAGDQTARAAGYRLLRHPKVAEEVEKRFAEAAAAAGCTRMQIIKRLFDLSQVDVVDFFLPGGGIKPPEDWPKFGRGRVTGYNSGTATAAEKIVFESEVKILLELLHEMTPPGQRKGDITVTHALTFDPVALQSKLLARSKELNGAIDITPT